MSLQERIQSVIDGTGARFGVAIRHLESGDEVMIDADSYYPLASVVKTPILVEAFYRIKAGEISLDDRWPLKTEDKNLPSGILTFMQDGLMPTVRDLLTLMIIISDNTATDAILKYLGKQAVTDRMRSLGLEHIHVSKTIRELFDDLLPNADPTQDLYELSKEEAESDGPPRGTFVYELTPENNIGTPRDLTRLAQLIFEGQTPDRETSDGILDILLQQQLNDRLPRLLPTGTRVAHKTGTLSGIRNGSGVIYASDTSHIAISVFTRWDDAAVWNDARGSYQRAFEIDAAIGEIALLAYEHYR
jgi:beta-lactamase class A